MGVKHLAGTPWHKEQMHRQEGDDRRYKGRCKYYEYDGNGCKRRCGRCIGSAHCEEYVAISEEEFRLRQMTQQKAKKKPSGGDDDDCYWY